jgi:hypothetical protein
MMVCQQKRQNTIIKRQEKYRSRYGARSWRVSYSPSGTSATSAGTSLLNEGVITVSESETNNQVPPVVPERKKGKKKSASTATANE